MKRVAVTAFAAAMWVMSAYIMENDRTDQLIEDWGNAFKDCRNLDPEAQTDAVREQRCKELLAYELQLKHVGCRITFSTTWRCPSIYRS